MAREKVLQGSRMAPVHSIFYKRSRVSCIMTQKQCNKDLKLAIQRKIYAVELEGFLCLKHGWTEATFHSIDYKAHEGAFKKEDTTQKYHSSQIQT